MPVAWFGLTVQEIEADGFHIDRKVEMLLSSDTPVGITKSMGLAMIGFADALAELQPDLLLVLGDRFEIFAAASAALIARIPIAHLHGGELTEGAFDDSLRHSITKMSHLHFVAADEYRDRVIQMGEHADRVFLTGGLGVDSIRNIPALKKKDLEKELGFNLKNRNLLVTFHPVTLDSGNSAHQFNELLIALSGLHDTHILFTLPNADTDGRILIKMIRDFCSTRDSASYKTSLGQLLYFSCITHFDGVVGNSSSGIAEVPSFKERLILVIDKKGVLWRSVIQTPPIVIQSLTHLSFFSVPSFSLNSEYPKPLFIWARTSINSYCQRNRKVHSRQCINKKSFRDIRI